MNNKRKLSFKVALSLGFATVLFLTILANDFVIGRQVTKELFSSQQNQQILLTRFITDSLNSDIVERRREIQQFSRLILPQLVHSPQSEIRAHLESLQQDYRFYSWIGYTDPHGNVLAGTNGILEGVNAAHRPWFHGALESDYIGDVHSALMLEKLLSPPPSGEPLRFIDIASAVYDDHGAVAGVLVAHVSFEWAKETIKDALKLTENPATSVYLVTQDSIVLYPEKLSGKRLPVALQANTSKVMDWPDEPHLTSTREIKHKNHPLTWQIVITTPMAIVSKHQDNLDLTILFTVIVATILGSLLATYYIDKVSLVLSRIASYATSVARGEKANKLYAHTHIEELQQLASAVRHTSIQLDAQRVTLIELNESLEQKVEERTHELADALEDLSNVQSKSKRMYAMVAHELRTPVAAIKMISEDASNWEEHRSKVLQLSEQLMLTLDDMKLAINPKLVRPVLSSQTDLIALSGDIKSLVQPVVKATNMHLNVVLPAQRDLSVVTFTIDVYRIKVTVSNLIKNACLHSQGNRVTVEFALNSDSNMLSVTVSDNGKGIPENEVEHLYEPFTRGNTQADGTGMGLNITKTWIEEIKGELSYRALSPGTQFTILVPITIAAQSPAFSVAESPIIHMNATVAFVEDNDILRVFAQSLLQEYFTRVDIFASSEELVAANTQFDILMTDYNLPGMNGAALIKQLKASGFTGPCAMVTASEDDDDVAEFHLAGADHVIGKPLTKAKIEALVVSFSGALA